MEVYVLFGIGVLLSVIGFLMIFVLNNIKDEIRDIKIQLSKIEGDLHERVTDMERRHSVEVVAIDRRLSHVEARCSATHRDQ
jgi:hypothetical protein